MYGRSARLEEPSRASPSRAWPRLPRLACHASPCPTRPGPAAPRRAPPRLPRLNCPAPPSLAPPRPDPPSRGCRAMPGHARAARPAQPDPAQPGLAVPSPDHLMIPPHGNMSTGNVFFLDSFGVPKLWC